MEGKAAVLGSPDFVMPFAALGLDTFPTESDAASVEENATSILKKKYVMVVVAENIARPAQAVFEVTAKQATPCVIVVPFTTAPSGIATEGLSMMLRLATGIDVLADQFCTAGILPAWKVNRAGWEPVIQ